MEYKKNDLMDELISRFYQSFALTLDTCDFVPAKINNAIYKMIFREMKKKFKEVNKEYKVIKKEDKTKLKMTLWLANKFRKRYFGKKENEKNQGVVEEDLFSDTTTNNNRESEFEENIEEVEEVKSYMD